VSASVSGLTPSSVYHFRIVAKNAGGGAEGSDETFKTLAPAPPSVLTGEGTTIAQTSATLNASVNPNGTNTECVLEYGTSIKYETSVPCTPAAGSESIQVAESAPVSGLAANTTYHFRVVGNYGASQQQLGADKTFKTLPNPPTVVTGEASAITQTSATLGASVNPNGGEVSECRFEFGNSTAYGSSAPCSAPPGSGEAPVALSASLSGLSASTTYHFRITATNAGGTSKGADKAFTTPANPGHGPGQGGSGSPGEGAGNGPAVTLISRSLLATRSGVLIVKVLCPATATSCVGKLTLRTLTAVATGATGGSSKRSKKVLTLTHGPFSLTGGQRKALKLKLTKAALELLSAASKVRGKATILAHDAAGASATTLATVTIRIKH
jgi:hypothetical protein